METPLTKNNYMSQFQENMQRDKRDIEELDDYLIQQFEQLDQLINTISSDNFFLKLPIILGIDAKLTLITELIQFDQLKIKEILRIVETDYSTYFKEICELDLSAKNKYSMVYNIL
ncbi:hypothetical protein QJ527_03495 [Enterococcus mundtii]|uniref:DUF7006 family protein n=1 Tax=Enterococcus TaxID=1350 RepID=UPI00044F4877|nr:MULTISPECIES: hypothetical protein [Enterococcus]AZP93148.1 hypothetical protein CYK55_08625 [Enterococcus mundtii]EYT96495.1 hypothetical protein AK89_03365 [Enterococcus mundtii CRL35]MDK4210611.1 hypothetical protein [Enterococcus mundtii]MDO7878133.1 hypothetical protein [Enterococcus mundtii]MEC3940420.1 hypothetical protein [Enterococcus mundtii]